MLKISTASEACISSWNALLEWQVSLTFPECTTSAKRQETYPWPGPLFAIGRTMFTTSVASALLAMKCQSYTSIWIKQKRWRAHAITFFHTPVRKAFYLQQCSKQADYKPAVSVPQTFRLPISCSAADILWHLNKKMIEESGDSSQPYSSQ